MALDPSAHIFYPDRAHHPLPHWGPKPPVSQICVPPRCFFLEIVPPEIRIQIYEHVLTFSRPLRRETNFRTINGKTNNNDNREMAVVSVSRLVFQETLPIFYGVNTFVCRDFEDMLSNQNLLANIRHVIVDKQGWNVGATDLKSLARAPKMQKIIVRCGTLFAKDRPYYAGPLTSQIFAWKNELPPITCFAIGRYGVATLPTIEFQDYWLVKVWEYVVRLKDCNEDERRKMQFTIRNNFVGSVAAMLYKRLRYNTDTIPTNFGSRLGCVAFHTALDPEVDQDPDLAAIFTPELSAIVVNLLRDYHNIPSDATVYRSSEFI